MNEGFDEILLGENSRSIYVAYKFSKDFYPEINDYGEIEIEEYIDENGNDATELVTRYLRLMKHLNPSGRITDIIENQLTFEPINDD